MIDDEEPESTSERVPESSDERLSCGSAHNCLPIVGIGASAGGLDALRALSKDLFIGVTSFFRETEAWSAIVVQVVDPIVASYAGDGPVRVWVPGCATGEEAYTLAILFAEAFERANFALKPGGFLVLGSSESLGAQQPEFRALAKKWRIFQPEGRSQLGLVEMPISRDAKRSVPRFPAQGRARREPRLADLAQQALVETFTPASVLVTRRYQVLYVYGDTTDYLVHPPGELTDDLMSVTRSELRLKTRAAMHQAICENRQLIVHGAKVMRGEAALPVVITVTPLQRPPPVAGLLLVSFHREPDEAPTQRRLTPGRVPRPRSCVASRTSSRSPGRSCRVRSRSCSPATRNWRPPRRSCSPSTRSSQPSTISSRTRWLKWSPPAMI